MVAFIEIRNETSPQTIYIEEKTCFDLSGHCEGWKREGRCVNKQDFMKEHCRLTCRYCSERHDTVKMMEIKKERANKNQNQNSWGDEF
jgi:predicted DNA-binding helix-hairpin-helix protein